jgi:RHS repeat-associated protein
VFFIHPDHLDTPRLIVNQANQPVWRWDSAPFGDTAANERPTAGIAADFAFNLRFPGQQYDRETGTHYNYFRDYEPATGRYVQSDPVGLWGGNATFNYADNDPLAYFDPDGLCPRALQLLGLCKPRPPKPHRPNLVPPPGGGLYVVRDCKGTVVYVGQTGSFSSRTRAHWGSGGQFSAFNQKCCPISVTYFPRPPGPGLDSLERRVIQHYRPPGNTHFNPNRPGYTPPKCC